MPFSVINKNSWQLGVKCFWIYEAFFILITFRKSRISNVYELYSHYLHFSTFFQMSMTYLRRTIECSARISYCLGRGRWLGRGSWSSSCAWWHISKTSISCISSAWGILGASDHSWTILSAAASGGRWPLLSWCYLLVYHCTTCRNTALLRIVYVMRKLLRWSNSYSMPNIV